MGPIGDLSEQVYEAVNRTGGSVPSNCFELLKAVFPSAEQAALSCLKSAVHSVVA
jgi:hypothetical protein